MSTQSQTATLSIVIAARNCADRIEGTIKPWLGLATEILVADQMSGDGTDERARLLGAKVLRNSPAGGNFDLNRKLAMQQATSDWILYIDTDERPTPALLEEIRAFLSTREAASMATIEPTLTANISAAHSSSPINGMRIPNLFYFLGRPLRHGLYDPNSSEIRMVRKGQWTYPCEEGFHRGLSVQGEVLKFKNPYKHFNVNSLSEWFLKTNQYTEHDAAKIVSTFSVGSDLSSTKPRIVTYRVFFSAFRFFMRNYFLRLGFLDGFHGLVSIFYFMLYHLTLKIKIWERVQRANQHEGQDYLEPIKVPNR